MPNVEAFARDIDFGQDVFQSPAWQVEHSLGDEIRLRAGDLERASAEANAAIAEREAHTYDAEQAAIDNARLLDRLVGVGQAQQQLLAAQGAVLAPLLEQTTALTRLAEDAAAEDTRRWRRGWRLQRGELIVGVLAVVFAGAAIWAAFAAAKAPVVTVTTPASPPPASATDPLP